jgi:hypothetical protein
MLYRCHAHLFAAADSPARLVPFDQAVAALAGLPQMLVEPDGSFVWTSRPGIAPAWQLDGNLVDGGETLYYVELKGSCPAEAFDELLKCVAAPTAKLAYEQVEAGITLDESAFRAAAAKNSGG